jgi:hypothetical protein
MDPSDFSKNNLYGQNPSPFVQPPRKKSNAWIYWVIGGSAVFIILVGILLSFAIKLGRGLGKTMGEVSKLMVDRMDSINRNDSAYRTISEEFSGYSNGEAYRIKADSLHARSNRLLILIETYSTAFRDTVALTKSGTLSFGISKKFFLESGRAKKLRNEIETYRQHTIDDLPGDSDAFLLQALLNTKTGSGILSWENMTFSQPPQNVQVNLNMLKVQIGIFEQEALKHQLSAFRANRGAPVTGIDSVATDTTIH